MTNRKATKKALFASAMSLLLCVTMLIGTTFAWFTDSASSKGNKIMAGNLDVDLLLWDGVSYVDIGDSEKPIFGSYESDKAQNVNINTLWEPGKTQVAYLKIKNNGNLALKYQVVLNTIDPADSNSLYEVMQYQIVPDATSDDDLAWNASSALKANLGSEIVSGDTWVSMDPGAEHNFALLVHMDENANNDYMNGKVEFDITVQATQLNAEEDSFGNQYDAIAPKDLTKDAASFKQLADAGTEEIVLGEKINVEDLGYVNFSQDTVVNGNGQSLVRDTASANPLLINTTNKVTFENVKFESTKGSAVLATRKVGANIEVNNCVFQNNAAPSTGNTGVQVYASDVTMVFNNCTFNNMPIETNSAYPNGIKLVFNNCTFNWTGDNCPGFIKIANSVEIDVDINNCKMNYTTDSQYTTSKTMISYNNPNKNSTIDINGLKVTGTRNNDKRWTICSNNKITVSTTGELIHTFNGEVIDFATYLYSY